MGCFSFLCKNSGKPALSTSADGDIVHLFLLKDGEVVEMMYGNYDSYGRVFKRGKMDSFNWKMGWSDVCELMHNEDPRNGIAMVLDRHYTGRVPTTRSEDDPNQGWGENYEILDQEREFPECKCPTHTVIHRFTRG
jgi:hypothetical protein